ncbi:hypothetical protein BH11MYX4_BH11MYX4_40480 [soil metagenome]
MPYRTASDPWAVPAPVAVSTGRRRLRPPRALVAGIVCGLLALGLGLGLRPELGPDDAPEVPASFVEVAPTVPEGTAPARRRYVGPDPMTAGGILRGRIFFVSDRRLRRYPSL